MALRWNWNEKCGEATLLQTVGEESKEFTLSLYTGNAYLIMFSEYEEGGQRKYNLYSFWVDKKHMENCLGISKGKENIYTGYQTFTKFRLNKKYCTYWKEITKALKKAFPDILIEYY